ncbi:NAD(+) diphosphatase [Aestuariibacter halophilus]|uniref:NAD(+) diphosphatase n=1 Tax=Fluctibacter halophilus TaxID=226011 RepID=A0ABS8GAT6_9ALTE|nr:NAD(+) diphosphatase [Aestuariibacter halophilus]MCC2617702.1 NAD(+) diphosphatase [Aestuariibacter halophilus]
MYDVDKQQAGWWFIFCNDRLLSPGESPQWVEAHWHDLPFLHDYEDQVVRVGEHQSKPCYAVDVGAQAPEGLDWTANSLRSMILGHLGEDSLNLIARAWQLTVFLRTHRWCGQCGSQMHRVQWEIATHCHRCQHRCYPRVSPCIIVAIRKDNRILLAQGPSQRERKMWSTLAGFVESGESLEQAVHREVLEEVGVNIRNVRYYGSQPWPFPHNLMVGFLADYDSGEIRVDGEEILVADWFDINDLPFVPPPVSIAGQLIEATKGLVNNNT